jgi:immunity protein, SdpI family
MKRSRLVACVALIALCEAATLLAYPRLPEMVATHWNAHGVADGYSSRWTLFVFMPAMMLGMIALFAALPWLSPRRFEVGSFAPTSSYLMLLIVALLAYVHLVIVWKAVGGTLDMSTAVLGAVSLFIAAIGNVLGKVRRNFFIGIRTPWTLASERVWYGTHRLAAKAFVAAGLAGAVIAFARLPFWCWVAVIVAGSVVPLAYSLVLYKRLEKAGELGGEAA